MKSHGSNLRFVPAASLSLEAYAAASTNAFEGYYVPLSLDAATLARRVRLEQHDLLNSLVAFEGEEAVAVAALAVRGTRGWCGGFAVVPRLRGRGVGRELLSALLTRARACGLRQLSLEVLAVNAPARRLYESAGMRVTRDLLVLERGGAGATTTGAPAPLEAEAAELLAHFRRLRAEPPAWQRELASLLAAELRGLCVGEPRDPRAYALVGRSLDGHAFLSDLAAADASAAEELCAALAHVAAPLRVVNEPERSPFVRPLLSHGFRETGRQHEMTMEL